MAEQARSRTAQSVAIVRALESRRPAVTRLFEDPFAARLLFSPLGRAAASAFAFPPVRIAARAVFERAFPGVMAGLVLRTRYLDDVFREGLGSAAQAVILGVGLDCRSIRIAAHAETPVFELDRPANLDWRASRLAGVAAPRRIVAAPIDFERESLAEGLERAGFDPAARTFFVWEGVTQYLSEEAFDATLALVGSCAPGSRLVLSYVVPEGAASESAASAAKSGEPWRTFFSPEALRARLSAKALEVLEDVGLDELHRRYLDPVGRDEPYWTIERFAVATVQDTSSPTPGAGPG